MSLSRKGIPLANLMIVDDSKLIRQRLRSILETLGHRIVAEAENGKEAIEIYERKADEIDLITLDIEMPGINGIEVLRLIQQQNPSANIVMISSVEDRAKVHQAIKLGAKHYFVKPFSEEKVREVIDKVLDHEPAPGQRPHQPPKPQPEPVAARSSDEPPLPAERLADLPFELFHMDERTILIIRRQIVDGDLPHLHGALQGLLYFRKMKFVVEFWEPAKHPEGSRMLLDFIQTVRDRQGRAAVVTADPSYYAHWVSVLRDEVYRAYKEIKW